jgi:dolichol-phosphate mannosyltransferase
VLGSRYVQGICVVNWDFKRLLLSKGATRYVQIITGMPFTDATGGFKCWRADALRSIGLENVFSNGYLFQVEMTYRAFRKGRRIAEIPIIFYERNLGRSKMHWRIIWEALWGVIRLRLLG